MNTENGYYLICYDVSDDKRRRRLVRWLEDFAYRIQYSVFIMKADDFKIAKVRQGINLSISEEDSVFIFPMDKKDWKTKELYGKECRELSYCDEQVIFL